jgi:hypothetical protein
MHTQSYLLILACLTPLAAGHLWLTEWLGDTLGKKQPVALERVTGYVAAHANETEIAIGVRRLRRGGASGRQV